jgi:peptidyl-prolyl cis-trans isomerase D
MKIQNFAKGIILKLVIGLVILSFVVFGIASFVGQNYNMWAIKVGKQKISQLKLEQDIQNYQKNILALLGENPEKRAEIEKLLESDYIRQTAVKNIINSSIQEQFAKEIGVYASESLIYKQIAEQKIFHDKNGKFDKTIFTNMLQQKQISEQQYIKSILNQVGGQIVQNSIAISHPININDALAFYKANEQSVVYDLLEIKSQNVVVDQNISEAEINENYQKNQANYKTPELRKIKYTIIDKKLFTNAINISDNEIADHYQQNQQQYQMPETRDVYHLMFGDKKDADDFVAKLNNAVANNTNHKTAFSSLAKQLKKDGEITLNNVAKNQILPELEKQIFALQINQISPVIESKAGFHVLLLNQINAPKLLELTKVSSNIKAKLLAEKQDKSFNQLLKDVSDFALVNNSLDDLATKFGLVTQELSVDKNEQNSKKWQDLPDFIENVFAAKLKQISKPFTIDADENKFYLLVVNEINEPKQLDLSEAKEMVKQSIITSKQQKQLPTFAQDLHKKILENPASVATIASKYNITIQKNNTAKRRDLFFTDDSQQIIGKNTLISLQKLFATKIGEPMQPIVFSDDLQLIAIVRDVKQSSENDQLTKAKKEAFDLFNYDIFQTYNDYLLKTKYPIKFNPKVLVANE